MKKQLDKEKIEKEAKELLDKFAKALERVGEKNDNFSFVDREDFVRAEGEGNQCEQNFKKSFLENSKNHDDDFIIAEKGDFK